MDAKKFPKWIKVLDDEETMGRAYCIAPLERFLISDDEITGVRDPSSYSDSELQDIAASLNSDGQMRMQNPIHVYLAKGEETLAVVGGNRRLSAALMLLKSGTFKEETPVRCYLYTTTNRGEILRIAARDNSYRLNYNEMEEYRQIVLLGKRGLRQDDIGAAMGMSVDTVKRYQSISIYAVLEKMLERKMPYSRLARIAEKLDKRTKEVKDGTQAFLENWLDKIVPERIKIKQEDAAKRNKTITTENLALGKLLEIGEFEGWIRDIEGGMVPDGVTGRFKTSH